MVESRCGLLCSECSYKEPNNCPGCLNAHGNMFHGECKMAKCCESRNLAHCGKCTDFACKMIVDLASDPVHGDNGKIIDRLKQWSIE